MERDLIFIEQEAAATFEAMKYKSITYSDHALDQIGKRPVSEEQVLWTLEKPDRTYPSKGKLVAERLTPEGITIRVVYVEKPEGPQEKSAIIVTAIPIGRKRGKRLWRSRS
jgi:hypothetical protein